MQANIVETKDGSSTIYLPHLNEHYHSTNGAYSESMHVFIESGLLHKINTNSNSISILEIGLGTGLNVLLTIANIKNAKIVYHALEPYPQEFEILNQLNYFARYSNLNKEIFNKIHTALFDFPLLLNHDFTFVKMKQTLELCQLPSQYDIVYFDAFAPNVQPEVWCKENFEKLYHAMVLNGVLVTYRAKGVVRRTLEQVGFSVERMAGPVGKREMLRATKI